MAVNPGFPLCSNLKGFWLEMDKKYFCDVQFFELKTCIFLSWQFFKKI